MTANHTSTTLRTGQGPGTRRTNDAVDHASGTEGRHSTPDRTTPVAWAAFGAWRVTAEDVLAAEAFDLPGADLSSEEVTELVLPAQADEFTCTSCFLVRHRSQIARRGSGQLVCSDCAG